MEVHVDAKQETIRKVSELIGLQSAGVSDSGGERLAAVAGTGAPAGDEKRTDDDRASGAAAPAEPESDTGENAASELADNAEGAPTDDTGGQANGSGDTPDSLEEQAITVKDLAEQLGLDAGDVYNELVIPLGDGEQVTLGEWKDRVDALRNVDGEREKVTKAKDEYERNLAKTRAELNALMQLIPAESREALITQAREHSSAYEQQQREAVLAAIPEWKESPQKLSADRDAIVAMGSEYGFSEPEITYTHDARTVRMLHDFLRLRERVSAMEAAAKRQATPTGKSVRGVKKSGRKLANAIAKAKQTRDHRSKESVVSELIRSQG